MKFLTLITCMDGRIQQPVMDYLKQKYPSHYPDTVTEAGPVKYLSENYFTPVFYSILNRLDISIEKHGSKQIFIVAHPDCAGNPQNKEKQIEQLHLAKKRLQTYYPDSDIHGLWVENNQKVIEI